MALRLLIIMILMAAACSTLADNASEDAFLKFIQNEAADLRSRYTPHESKEGWLKRRTALRKQLLKAWGGFPDKPADLHPRRVGILKREGYRVEKLLFQTMPGIWMTANAYVPDTTGKHPAVLAVHGHWPGAKQDPVVQSRCIGLVKQGYFVLAVDAFGAGERATGKALGEYHGEMTAATLFPVGLTLSGIQVYENMRAVDYLLTRPEVDGTKLGVTGASGGGNQTMYAGAWDTRLHAAVPVCSVGNYQAYLGSACCMCEVVPGALRFAEESDILSLVSPRALLVINATRDAHQFSVPEANKSVEGAQEIYRLLGVPDAIRHDTFESGHDYSSPMRSAMYGWMDKYLKGVGDGSPKPEPEIHTEDPEALRCFPGNTRPDDYITLPKFAVLKARELTAKRPLVSGKDAWHVRKIEMRRILSSRVLALPADQPGQMPVGNVTIHAPAGRESSSISFEPEPGILLTGKLVEQGIGTPISVVIDLDGCDSDRCKSFAAALEKGGQSVLTVDLRAIGSHAVAKDGVGHAPDHNSAEWALWIGRPLLGQWVQDIRRLLDALQTSGHLTGGKVNLIGLGSAGTVVLAAAAIEPRVAAVAAINSLTSYISDTPYRGQRLGLFAPGILREVGDVCDIASLSYAAKVIIAGGVLGDGTAAGQAILHAAFERTLSANRLSQAHAEIIVREAMAPDEVVRLITRSHGQ